MCNLSQGIKEAGIAEGREEGRVEGRSEGRAEEIIETGYEFGLSEQDILERLQKKLSIPLQKAQEYLLMFGVESNIFVNGFAKEGCNAYRGI